MKKIFNITKAILLFILYISFNSIVVDLLKKFFNIDAKALSGNYKILLLSLCEASLFIIFGLIYRKILKKDFIDFKNNISNYLYKGVIAWGVSVILMIISNIIISTYVGSTASNEQVVQQIIKIYPLYMLFSSAIYAPFMEELIFRKSLRDCINNKLVFILASGLLFGYVHTLTNPDSIKELFFIIPYAIVGSAFAYIYTKTDNIFVSITLHALHNLIVVSISILGVLYGI